MLRCSPYEYVVLSTSKGDQEGQERWRIFSGNAMTLPHQLGQIEQPPNTSINQTLEKGMYYARDL